VGTPHVYAENPRALAFVFGYAQAEDHLEAMLAAYRIANGRAAEVFGESYAASDEFSLKMGHAALARNIYASLDPLTRAFAKVSRWASTPGLSNTLNRRLHGPTAPSPRISSRSCTAI
jgi:acyl-homoserine lactone acylase PvdQ